MTVDDIKRLNYIKYTAYRGLVGNPHSIYYCIIKFVLATIKSILFWRRNRLEVREVLIFAESINNLKSVQNIIDNLPKEKYTVWGRDFSQKKPYTKICLLSFIYLPFFLKLYISSSKEDRLLIRAYSYDFIMACANYEVFEKILVNNPQLKMIVLANDHCLVNRVLVELAEKFNIKSLYVQHASVTTAFPPLRFDYAFLDGLESFEKYKIVGNMRGRIFLSGSPRFDAFHSYKCESKKYHVGIALNEFDSEEQALELCKYLKVNYSDKIIVRPHPGMLNSSNLLFHKEKFLKEGIPVSDPRKDLSYVFISELRVLVANESGIHLDAALMSVPSLLYNFSNNEVMDWYSFIKNGLVRKCDSFEDLVGSLNFRYEVPQEVVRYYAASYNSQKEGKVGEMIATFIKQELLDSEEVAFDYIYSIMNRKDEYAEYRN